MEPFGRRRATAIGTSRPPAQEQQSGNVGGGGAAAVAALPQPGIKAATAAATKSDGIMPGGSGNPSSEAAAAIPPVSTVASIPASGAGQDASRVAASVAGLGINDGQTVPPALSNNCTGRLAVTASDDAAPSGSGDWHPRHISSGVAPPEQTTIPSAAAVPAAAQLPPSKAKSEKWSPRKQPRAQPASISKVQAAAAPAGLTAPASKPLNPAQGTRKQRDTRSTQQQPNRMGVNTNIAGSSRGSQAAAAVEAPGRAAAPRNKKKAPGAASASAAPVAAYAATAYAQELAPAALPLPPAAQALEFEEEDCSGLPAAEMEARRAQQLIDYASLLLQAATVTSAERVLLGPAAPPENRPASAAELLISYGVRPPTSRAERAATIRQQVNEGVRVLEEHRQLKLKLAQKPGLKADVRRKLEAEAAADQQAQSELIHMAVQAAVEAREHA